MQLTSFFGAILLASSSVIGAPTEQKKADGISDLIGDSFDYIGNFASSIVDKFSDQYDYPTATIQPHPDFTILPYPYTSNWQSPEATIQPYPDASILPYPDASILPYPDATIQPYPDATIQPYPDATILPYPEATIEAPRGKTGYYGGHNGY